MKKESFNNSGTFNEYKKTSHSVRKFPIIFKSGIIHFEN